MGSQDQNASFVALFNRVPRPTKIIFFLIVVFALVGVSLAFVGMANAEPAHRGQCNTIAKDESTKAKKAVEPEKKPATKRRLRREDSSSKKLLAASALPDKLAFVPNPGANDVGITAVRPSEVIFVGVTKFAGKETKPRAFRVIANNQ